MKGFNQLLLAAVLLFSVKNVSAQNQTMRLKSPDSRLTLTVSSVNNKLVYNVQAGNVDVIKQSALGLTIDGVDLGTNAKITAAPVLSKINETYTVLGNHTNVSNRANEAEIPVVASGVKYSLFIRAYNDGVAIRYSLPANPKHIDKESTSWVLPDNITKIAWADYHQSYEAYNHLTAMDKIPEGKAIMPPVTYEISGNYVSITEADCESFSDMALMRTGNVFSVNYPFAKTGWDVKPYAGTDKRVLVGMYKGKSVSPWRTMIIAKNLNGLVNSDLVMNLCPAPAPGNDFSWVKPGRSLWQWWSVGSPKYEDQKNWYDAAVKLKWEYYLVDDGWRNWKQPGKDQWQLLKEVVDYGKSVGIKSIIWVDSKEFRKAPERKAYLDKVKALGADGIKIDFIPDATAEIMQWYMETMQECTDLKLLVNFHGSVKPTGLRRTYPNDITREAVRGNEYQMTRYRRVMAAEHEVTIPFTRYLAGAADYTPVILNPKELSTVKFTWPREFAQAIVYLSPITHFTDQYSFYVESPMLDLFQQIPTTWDETKVLSCTEMGQVVAFARRKGDTWWIGVMNGDTEREVKIPLNFLKKSKKATLIYDAATNTSIDRKEQTVSGKDVLTIKLRSGGGFVAKM
jgi:alpha-glucosidase